jgi:hypothetical protein
MFSKVYLGHSGVLVCTAESVNARNIKIFQMRRLPADRHEFQPEGLEDASSSGSYFF